MSQETELSGIDAGVYARLSQRARTRARRSRNRAIGWLLGGALAAALSFLAAPAVADMQRYFAQTGTFCPEGSTECQPQSEIIDMEAPDVSKLVASMYPEDIALPPGVTRDEVTIEVQRGFPNMENTITFDQNIVAAYEEVIFCSWVDEWLAADTARNEAALAEATRALVGALAWPGPFVQGEDGLFLRTIFAEAAESGDRTGIQAAADLGSCSSALAPMPNQWLVDKSAKR